MVIEVLDDIGSGKETIGGSGRRICLSSVLTKWHAVTSDI